MSERCDLSDLLIEQCACRLHRGGLTPDEEAAVERRSRYNADMPVGPWCVANYTGTCTACGCEIRVGYPIRADGDGGWKCCID